MTTTKPNVNLNDRLELRDAAKALSVSGSTLLRYTHEGKIRAGIKRSNNRRFWTGADIIKFWMSEF